MKKQRTFAFSQAEEGGQERIIRIYDTTQKRGIYGELHDASLNPFNYIFVISKNLSGSAQKVNKGSKLKETPFDDSIHTVSNIQSNANTSKNDNVDRIKTGDDLDGSFAL